MVRKTSELGKLVCIKNPIGICFVSFASSGSSDDALSVLERRNFKGVYYNVVHVSNQSAEGTTSTPARACHVVLIGGFQLAARG